MKKTISILLVLVMALALAVTAYAVTASGDTIVYRTSSGSKYHLEDCASLKGNGIEITLAEAVEKGLEPCSKCNPPTLAEASQESSASTAVTAGTAAAAAGAASASKGFSPLLAFIIGLVVGAVGITLVRSKLLAAVEAGDAEISDEEIVDDSADENE